MAALGVTRGPISRDIAREVRDSGAAGRTSAPSSSSGGGRGTPNCGPNARWNGTRCVPITTSGSSDAKLKAELDKMTPAQWEGLGRLLGGSGASSGAGTVGRTGSADQMERNIAAGRTASGGVIGGQRRLAPDSAAERAEWETVARGWHDYNQDLIAAEFERLTGMPWTGRRPFNNGSDNYVIGQGPSAGGGAGTSMGAGGGTGTSAGVGAGATVPAGATTGAIAGGPTSSNPLVQQALDMLKQSVTAAGTDIAGGLANTLTGLRSVDPMARFAFNTGNVLIPEAPAAGYLDYIGGGTGGVEAVRGLGQQLLNQSLGNIGQYAQGVGTAAQNWRNAQQSVAQNTADIAARMLAMQAFANEQAIRRNELARNTNIQDSLLNAILQYGNMSRSGGGGSISAPTLPFNTLTVPNYGTVTFPSTLFGG